MNLGKYIYMYFNLCKFWDFFKFLRVLLAPISVVYVRLVVWQHDGDAKWVVLRYGLERPVSTTLRANRVPWSPPGYGLRRASAGRN